MLYEISNLKKIFDDRNVLDIESLEIEKKNIYALLGPNGSGKTTFLKIIGFLEPPTSGSIHYRSKPVRFQESHLQSLRKEVVMVNQHPILFTTSVYKNLEFGLKIRKISSGKRVRIIEETLDMVGMRHFIYAPAHQLSGGETQRVAFARALALSPSVILCDEPTSSVDPENRGAIINLLRQINDEKQITLVFTTHDRSQASNLAHQTLYLEHGKLGSASYENIFTTVFSRINEKESRCIIQNMVELVLPVQKTGKTRLLINPEKIRIIDDKERTTSGNFIEGIINQISNENGNIRIIVESGAYFTIMMTGKDYRKSKPIVGDSVNLNIPNEAISVMD